MYTGLIVLFLAILLIVLVELFLLFMVITSKNRQQNRQQQFVDFLQYMMNSTIPITEKNKKANYTLARVKKHGFQDDFYLAMTLVTPPIWQNEPEIYEKLVVNAQLREHYTQMLHSRQPDLQALACKRLANLQCQKAEAHIEKLALSSDGSIQFHAVNALAAMGCTRSLENLFINHSEKLHISYRYLCEALLRYSGNLDELLRQMISQGDDYVKKICLQVCAQTGSTALREHYSACLRSKKINLRIAAINVISADYMPEYENRIILLLNDPHWEVRLADIKCLQQHGTAKCLPALGEATLDSEWGIRIQAARAILNIEGGVHFAQSLLQECVDMYAQEAILAALQKHMSYKENQLLQVD